MKLPLFLIVERLSVRFPGMVANVADETEEYRFSAVWLPGMAEQKQCIYLLQNASVFGPTQFRICAVPGKPDTCPANMALIPAQLYEISEYLNSLWMELEDWQNRMQELLIRQASVRDLMEASASLLENPLLLLDEDFIERDSVNAQDVPASLRIFGEDNPRGLETLSALHQSQNFKKMLSAGDVFLVPAKILPVRSLFCNLYRNDQRRGTLVLMEQRRPLRSGDRWILRLLGKFAEYSVERYEYSEDRPDKLGMTLSSMLANPMADMAEIGRSLNALDWKPEDRYLCIVIRRNDVSGEQGTDNRLAALIRAEHPYCSCFLYNDGLVCYVKLSAADYDSDRFSASMKLLIRENYLRAGFSRAMRGYAYLQKQYQQAVAAMEFGEKSNPYRWIHYFDELAFPYLLQQASAVFPVEMVCHKGISDLEEYDRDHGTDYIRTLRTWINSGYNAVHAAEELYIHRSTFLYRMEKIRELLDSSLDDPDELLFLSLSLRMRG